MLPLIRNAFCCVKICDFVIKPVKYQNLSLNYRVIVKWLNFLFQLDKWELDYLGLLSVTM